MFENILDYLRIALYALLILLCYLLFQAWDKDHPRLPAVGTPAAAVERSGSSYVPSAVNAGAEAAGAPIAQPGAPVVPAQEKGQIINVQTDVLNVSIDTRGGDIVRVSLPKYPESLGSRQPIMLLNDDPKTEYVAESGLLSKQGPDTSQAQALYKTAQTEYSLQPGQNELTVKLDWQDSNGLKVTKNFTFTRNSYEINVGYDINNQSSQPWEGSLYTQLLRTNNPPPNHGGFINLATYFGAAVSSPKAPFTKISFKDMEKTNLNQTVKDGWAAMIQHYFISSWIPAKTAVSNYYTRVTSNSLYTVGMIGEPLKAAPGASVTTGAKLYVGPAIADLLEKAAPSLKLTIDYGWFWFISGIIFWMMQKIYDVIGNWGWSIVLVTVIIKLLFYQLSAKSFRSMAAMKKLQPKIEMLKERYADDKQKMTQATLELYRQEKVNPMSGCLPILIQIPVFIALYWVLVESVQLRQAPFIFWIHDLSQQDPYYVLPLLMGVSMFIQQRLNPPPPDPLQAKIMMLMPVIFTVMFANFPAGLMLYWFVNNTLSFLQQWYVMRKLENEPNVKKK
ncbi:Membrane protein insertase YidC [Aquicella siphonis]|uniref:Membrane protein insertase YidC n=1 Tax=Aquicella siphonis TaxID=254247 RepID=A0A5E4PK82_9COXI|nr:membrane protein insertase YidC [Aquicella siphonis]VVC76928.1 Membrane protein insertase YidC [Aquicella siphonis]